MLRSPKSMKLYSSFEDQPLPQAYSTPRPSIHPESVSEADAPTPGAFSVALPQAPPPLTYQSQRSCTSPRRSASVPSQSTSKLTGPTRPTGPTKEPSIPVQENCPSTP